MKLADLKTPAFLIDLARLKDNLQLMKDRAQKHAVSLRPHVKTHKTAEIARMQTTPAAPGITVSTLAEARFYQEAGFNDITYAFPITANKLVETAELTANLENFNILLDQPQTLTAVESCGREHGICFNVFLKVDCGYHRAGVDPTAPASIELARRLAKSDHIEFRGILTHAGHSYHCSNPAEIVGIAEQEREVMAQFADRLRQSEIACDTVSVGSTPTAMHAPDWGASQKFVRAIMSFLTNFRPTSAPADRSRSRPRC